MAASSAFVAFALFAAGDWWSRLRHDTRLEYVCKPAALAALVVAAVLIDPAAGAEDRRVWFVAALVCSLAGDVLLMLPNRFVLGLAAFLVAHVCYVAGFWVDDPDHWAALALGAALVVVAIGPVGFRIVRGARTAPGLAGPVAAYIAAISAMVVSAFASGIPVAMAGAVLFAGSDSMIGWDRFVRPQSWAPVAIMVTYHLGQALFVVSLLY